MNIEDITLKKLFYVAVKRWKTLLVFTIFFALVAYLYSSFFVTPMYKASVNLFIKNTEGSTIVTTSEISAQRTLADTYQSVFTTDEIMIYFEDVLNEKFETNTFNYRDLKSWVNVGKKADIEIMNLSVITPDVNTSKQICEVFCVDVVDRAKDIVEKGDIVTLGEIQTFSNPVSPNVMKNTFIGGFAGFALTFLVYLVLYIFNNKVTNKAEFEKRFDISVLAQIPDPASLVKGSYSYNEKNN